MRELQDIEQAVTFLSETKRLIYERPGLFAVLLPSASDTTLDVAPTDPAEDVVAPTDSAEDVADPDVE